VRARAAAASENSRELSHASEPSDPSMLPPRCPHIYGATAPSSCGTVQRSSSMAPERWAPMPPRVGLVICGRGWVLMTMALAAAAHLPGARRSSSGSAAAAAGCDLFQGRWVADKSYPLYDASACPFVPDVFDCRRNGRPDDAYLKFRWSPANCRLPRYESQVLAQLAAQRKPTNVVAHARRLSSAGSTARIS
jgi:hypothetical protein